MSGLAMDPKASVRLLEGRQVLVVEDSLLQRGHAVELLRGLGAAAVHEAGNGVEGLARLGQASVDLVVTDLEMPQMDGITFIGEFAARGFRPALVILSGLDPAILFTVRLMAETYGLQVLGAIPKPLSAEGLRCLFKGAGRLAGAGLGASPATAWGPSPEELRHGFGQGEFTNFFQPKVTFEGAHFRGVEALARWRNPKHGLLGPAAFLPGLESQGELLEALSLALLREAGQAWQAWRRRGLNLELALNLPLGCLGNAAFPGLLLEMAQELGLEARRLRIEVAEAGAGAWTATVRQGLERLREAGIGLCLENLGTSLESLALLESLPFSAVKLDRSVTANLPHSERHRAIAGRLVEQAAARSVVPMAAGIETLEAWRALKALGYEQGQGFLIGRPMPGEQLGEWALQGRAALREDPEGAPGSHAPSHPN